MAKEASAFNAIIQADREKKKKQELADKIFGNGRRPSATGAGNGNGRKVPTGPASLTSRGGITKALRGPRSNASLNATAPRYPTSFKPQVANEGRGGSQQRAVSQPNLNRRNQILSNVLNGGGVAPHNLRSQVNVTQAPVNGVGISIRGMSEVSSTFTVIAQNFAPGTTAADIEAVLAPEPAEAGLVRCRLVASNPTVIAELVFSKRDTADTIITTFNNKKADGRLLHVYMQNSRPELARKRAVPNPAPSSAPAHDEDMVDAEDGGRAYDDGIPSQAVYTPPRGVRAQPTIQDGRYGFSDDAVTASDTSYQGNRRQNQFDRRGRGHRQGGGLVSDSILTRNDRFDNNRSNGRNSKR